MLAKLTNDADLDAFPSRRVDGVERVRFRFDPIDSGLASDFPSRRRIADVGDVLVRAIPIRFVHAGNLMVVHFID